MEVVCSQESTSSSTEDRHRLADTPAMIQCTTCTMAGRQRVGSMSRNRSTPTCWLRANTVAAPKKTSTIIRARAISSAQSTGSCRK
jgi:hypothetical protein